MSGSWGCAAPAVVAAGLLVVLVIAILLAPPGADEQTATPTSGSTPTVLIRATPTAQRLICVVSDTTCLNPQWWRP